MFGRSGCFELVPGAEPVDRAGQAVLDGHLWSPAEVSFRVLVPEQQRSVLGYENAERDLGWSPQVSIEDGLARTVDWFRTRHELEAS